MTALTRPLRRLLGRSSQPTAEATAPVVPPVVAEHPGVAIEIPESDPLFAFLQAAPGPVDLAKLELSSNALDELRAAGVALVVPLVTQGELIGTLNLGPRLSEQEYSTDDRRLLATLAAQAAPAIRVAQLVREQAAEAAERERFEQELKVAQLIQQQFLPRELPDLREWQIAAYYGPARVVGGDFYDFIDLGGGRIGVVVGDVTDKGVPAALVMARTHSILRAEAPRLVEPGLVLARANELLVPEMPARMFVTCLYGVLEPATGSFRFANAGHNLPYVRTADGVIELRATGLPLGLMPGIAYEETASAIGPGDAVLFYSDGLVEQHGPDREMYGFPRLREAMGEAGTGSELLDRLLDELHRFTGTAWEQEDDITL
ncbi:MAG TPA: PP2C family protein-serine/threonine phosphatase, partial [Candidatus Limnocylindrales bacterium]|nr:PP2C family protein-serine/threonine phosphatase [Candidatus Limnocylindrales bacterium]